MNALHFSSVNTQLIRFIGFMVLNANCTSITDGLMVCIETLILFRYKQLNNKHAATTISHICTKRFHYDPTSMLASNSSTLKRCSACKCVRDQTDPSSQINSKNSNSVCDETHSIVGNRFKPSITTDSFGRVR